jgi:hypothetical protein
MKTDARLPIYQTKVLSIPSYHSAARLPIYQSEVIMRAFGWRHFVLDMIVLAGREVVMCLS